MMDGARGTIEAIAIKNLQEVLRSKGVSGEALFAKYDLDGDGTLSENEFAAALESITGQQAPAAILRAVFGAIDINSDGSVDLTEILVLLEGGPTDSIPAGGGVSISGHPNDSYNGEYAMQETPINGKPWYKSAAGNRLYYYNANSGGAPSWSLDDREQDGSNDWYRGGWSRPRGDGSLPTGSRRWVGVGKITVSAASGPESPPKGLEAWTNAPIEILDATPGQPVRFRINEVPSSNDAWVGIYPVSAGDNEHGEDRWRWLRDIDVNNASLPGQSEGQWSIRVFSDGGYTLHNRVDFTAGASPPPSSPTIKITPSRSSYKSDEGINFSFISPELPNDAWIGIVPAEIPHGDEAVNDQHDTSYKYLEGRTSDAFSLPNPGPGEWTLRLHDTDNNGREIAYVAFEVTDVARPPADAGESDFDRVTGNFAEMLPKLEQSITSNNGMSLEQARSIADAEVEKEIEKLPFSVQSAARRIWRIRADSMQDQIASRMPSPEAIAAGAAAVGVAGAITADMRENAEEEATAAAKAEEEAPADPEDLKYASHDTWHEERHVDAPEQVDIPEQVDVREQRGSAWHDSHRVTRSSRVSVPDRVSVTSRRRFSPPPRQMETPEPVTPKGTLGVDDNAPPAPLGLADLAAAFSEARMLSDQRRLAESVEGQSHDISIKVTTAPERTFGIGVDDEYRGGSTIIAEVPGVGEVDIRLRNDADSGSFRRGSEHSLNASIAGWNGVRKRLILNAQ